MTETAGGYDETRGPLFGDAFLLQLRAKAVTIPACLRPFDSEFFEHCTVCQRGLLDDDDGYLVVRNFQGSEVVYEMGLCVDCADQLSSSYSDESRQYLDGLFVASGWGQQALARQDDIPDDWDHALATCALTGQPRDEFAEYQVVGHCRGRELLVSFFPYVIGTRGIELLSAGLSRATRDTWDRFVGDHLGLPPELRSLPI